ncbi:MAG: hypothetical protein NXI16_02375 [Alphaproteobacteria bacterium]|nr:hypothetical protein [Alphaproteobacteria bacterium]
MDGAALAIRLLSIPEEKQREALFYMMQGQNRALPYGLKSLEGVSGKSCVAFIALFGFDARTAAQLAQQVMDDNPGCPLMRQLLPNIRQTVIDYGVHLQHHRLEQEARDMYGHTAWVEPDGEESLMIRLIDEMRSRRAHIRSELSPSDRPGFLLHISAWGDTFIEHALRGPIACALAPTNLPAIARDAPVTVLIHTTEQGIEAFRDHDAIAALQKICSIRYEVLPDWLVSPSSPLISNRVRWSRRVTSFALWDAYVRAQALGADFVSPGADAYYANTYLSGIRRHLRAGKKAVLTVPWRAQTQDFMAALASEGISTTGPSLNIPSDAGYRAQMASLHPSYRDLHPSADDPKRVPGDPVSVFFPRTDGFVIRCAQLYTAGVSKDAIPDDLICDLHTHDARFFSDLRGADDGEEMFHILRHPPEDLFYTVLDEGGIVAERGYVVDPATVAKSATKWCNQWMDWRNIRWAFEQEFVYRLPEGHRYDPPGHCSDESAFMAAVLSEYDGHWGSATAKAEAHGQ